MGEFVIRIPRASVAVSEAEVLEFLVASGDRVEEGAPLFVMATEKVDQEVAAGAGGTVTWTGEVGTVYDMGAEIGVITYEED